MARPRDRSSTFLDVMRRQWDPAHRRRPSLRHPEFIRGLRLTQTLAAHVGCVNAVAFDERATRLVSGSDDLRVCVWGVGAGFPLVGSVHTGHTHNIFSAEFVPGSNASKCVTTSGDGDVRLIDLERGFASTPRPPPPRRGDRRYFDRAAPDNPAARSVFHGDDLERAGMGMKVRFVPHHPDVFLTTHQDGRVRRFDLRAPTNRSGGGGAHETIVDLSVQGSLSDIAFDPSAPALFALGCDDPYVRIFDVRHVESGGGADGAGGASRRRRRGRSPRARENLAGDGTIPVVAKYAPSARHGFNARSLRFDGVSGLAYGRDGELAVTYRGEHLYVLNQRALERSRADDGWSRGATAFGGGGAGDGLGLDLDLELDAREMDERGWRAFAGATTTTTTTTTSRSPTPGTDGGGGRRRETSPEFGYASPREAGSRSASRSPEPRTAAGAVASGRRPDGDAPLDDDDDDARERRSEGGEGDGSSEDEEEEDGAAAPATARADAERRSISLPRSRIASPEFGGGDDGGWGLFPEDPLLFHDPAVRRYVGHKNVKTFLKGVAFLCDDAYVSTGGDCGGLFIWRKDTCELVRRLQADGQVVNNVCPHPHLPTIVTSGIDDEMRVWEPGEGVHTATMPTRDDDASDEDLDDFFGRGASGESESESESESDDDGDHVTEITEITLRDGDHVAYGELFLPPIERTPTSEEIAAAEEEAEEDAPPPPPPAPEDGEIEPAADEDDEGSGSGSDAPERKRPKAA